MRQSRDLVENINQQDRVEEVLSNTVNRDDNIQDVDEMLVVNICALSEPDDFLPQQPEKSKNFDLLYFVQSTEEHIGSAYLGISLAALDCSESLRAFVDSFSALALHLDLHEIFLPSLDSEHLQYVHARSSLSSIHQKVQFSPILNVVGDTHKDGDRSLDCTHSAHKVLLPVLLV